MDRLDIWLNIHKVDYEKLSAGESDAESAETIRARVMAARQVQLNRFKHNGISKQFNSEMDAEDLEKFASLSQKARQALKQSAKQLELSGRGFHRIIKIARTIADLDRSKDILTQHILEALQYRQKIL